MSGNVSNTCVRFCSRLDATTEPTLAICAGAPYKDDHFRYHHIHHAAANMYVSFRQFFSVCPMTFLVCFVCFRFSASYILVMAFEEVLICCKFGFYVFSKAIRSSTSARKSSYQWNRICM